MFETWSKCGDMVIPKLRRLVAAVRPSGHMGFEVDKAGLRPVFSEYFRFPRQSFHLLLNPYHHPSSFGAGTIDHLVASDTVDSISLHRKKQKTGMETWKTMGVMQIAKKCKHINILEKFITFAVHKNKLN
jgi:hypothetical protein